MTRKMVHLMGVNFRISGLSWTPNSFRIPTVPLLNGME